MKRKISILLLAGMMATFSGCPPKEPNNDLSLLAALAMGNPTTITYGTGTGTGTGTSTSSTWTPATSPTTNRLRSVRYIKGEFWAVGWNGTVIKSTDGISWASAGVGCASTSHELEDIATDGTNILIAGWSGVLYKFDGAIWTCATRVGTTDYDWAGIKYLNGLWILYGNYMPALMTDYRMALATSTDGTTWLPVYDTGAARKSTNSLATLRDAIYNAGKYYIVGGNGWITSCSTACGTLGNWTFGQVLSAKYYSGVFFRSGTYYLMTEYNSARYAYELSDTTTDWTTMTPNTSFGLNGVNESLDTGSNVYVIGFGTLKSTTNGTTWTSEGYSAAEDSIACSATRCVAVGASGIITYK